MYTPCDMQLFVVWAISRIVVVERVTVREAMRHLRELMAIVITLEFFVAQVHEDVVKGVFCMPVTGICRGLGIARKYIGKISSWG